MPGHGNPADSDEASLKISYSIAVLSFNEGYLPEARAQLNRIVSINPSYRQAALYLEKIRVIDATYTEAAKAFTNGHHLKALPLFLQVVRYYPDSQVMINQCRHYLTLSIPAWEKEIIEAFNQQDYSRCIELSMTILMVDPDHRTAPVYLNKARKRKEAIRRIRRES